MNKEELVHFAKKLAAKGLTAGSGGNISIRLDDIVWIKPSGFAMEDLTADELSGLAWPSGKEIHGPHRPTSEYRMHLDIYSARADIQVIFHTHSPWASGVISAGIDFRPMFPEVVLDLGQTITVPYITPGTPELAAAVAQAAKEHETIFLANHGIVALGKNLRQAYERCCIVEDAAKSLLAAKLVGQPQYLAAEEISRLRQAPAARYRDEIMSRS